MYEDELGAMFKRIVTMAEDRFSDYAVGKAAMEFVEAAMNRVIEKQMARVSEPMTAAERMDIAAESGAYDTWTLNELAGAADAGPRD